MSTKRDLIQAIESTISNASISRDIATQTQKAAQNTLDIAPKILEFVNAAPENDNSIDQLKPLISLWTSLGDSYRSIKVSLPSSNELLPMAQSTANATASGVIEAARSWFPSNNPPPRLSEARSAIYSSMSRQTNFAELVSVMKSFGLDRAYGSNCSPIELLKQSKQSLDLPLPTDEGGGIQTIIPLRSAIDAAISDLLRRKSTQSKAKQKKDKITLIGTECSKANVNSIVFNTLAQDFSDLHDKLSNAKEARLTREEVKSLFDRGVQFLSNFLSLLDPPRFRQ